MMRKPLLRLLGLASFILFLDFTSKGLTHFLFRPWEHAAPFFPFGGISVFQNFLGIDFCIHHVTNRGAAWGVGEGLQNVLLCLRIGVVVGMLLYLALSSKAFQYRYQLTMIMAGGVGNILDYFIYGHVVDMFHFIFWGYSYPVFNVADISIFLGIAGLFCTSFIQRKESVLHPQN